MNPPSRKSDRSNNSLRLTKNISRTLPKSGQSVARTPMRSPFLKREPFWKKYNPLKRRRFVFTWKKLFLWLLGCFIIFTIGVSSVFAYYVRDLPNPKKLENRPIIQSTEIFDRNGKSLYSIHGEENRTVVKGTDINPFIKEATVAVEDSDFYGHHGISFKGLARAILGHIPFAKRFFPATELTGGGSTITQQYIKNALLTRDATLTRKLKEAILAVEVEQIYSKDEILTGYLNQIPYGSNAYGVEAASRTYFNKSSSLLTLSEAATLAAIPQAPTYYSPYGTHLDDLFVRKNYILDRMVAVKFITATQAAQAKKDAPTPQTPTFRQQNDLLAPHFVFYVRQKLLDMMDPDPAIAEQKLDQAGYKVTTSLDIPTQQLAQGIISDMGAAAVKRYNATNASLSAVDPKTGEILAMVGSIDYNTSKSGNTNFANAKLQPGSSFKPFVYATAFGPKYKYSPGSITYDLVTNFGGSSKSNEYIPKDYNGSCEFCGPVTNREALDSSLNVSAVKNLYLAGITESIATAHAMGLTTLQNDPNNYGLSIVLGSGEVRPVEMAGAYGAFANGGMLKPLTSILKIEKDGAIVKDFTSGAATKALEPEVAYEMSNVLSDNAARTKIFGANNSLTLRDRPVAAKTGTTDNFRDTWTIGFTPSISVAVWVGNNDPNKSMVKGADGSYVAAPIWNKFMSSYLKGKPVEQFARPSTVKDVQIDKLSGKLPTDQTPDNDKITDIMAPWQIPGPNEKDNVHVTVGIDQASGKLATDLTPPDQIVKKTFFNIHSEVPTNPNWENPVQEWARANGGGTQPPTDKDDIHVDANKPTVSIVAPVDGTKVNATFNIQAEVGGAKDITKLEFFLDNVSIAALTTAPWTTTYDANSLASGSHVIQAQVTNSVGLTQKSQVTVTTASASTSVAPGPVSGVSAIPGSHVTLKPIQLSWTNPANTDLATANIYQSLSNDPSELGTKVKAVPATPGGPDSADIDTASLASGKTYYYTIRPVNAGGQENQSTLKISVLVL
jgi:membrane peptidoglycan carboxypeptidase